jgi:hypothetical protein
MPQVKIKGYEFNAMIVRDSFTRRAQKFYNNIIKTLRAVGVTEDDIDMKLEPAPIRNLPASITWYLDGHQLHYSYKAGTKYVENLYIISKILEFEVKQILAEEKTMNQFILDFSEDDEVEHQRKEARKLLGVEEDSLDLELMNKKYKLLAKEAHPDMPDGDTERFKNLNRAHKIVKRELA